MANFSLSLNILRCFYFEPKEILTPFLTDTNASNSYIET